MYNITLISTVHKEYGNCNSNELLKIIENIRPDVIFLEAQKDNFSRYAQMIFSQFGIFNERLEIKAIQKYSQNHTFEYVPVLDIGLSDEFETKIKIVSDNKDLQRLLDNYNFLETNGGFQFLNCEESIALQEEMREVENRIINNKIMQQRVKASIDEYENSMLHNIYTFCNNKSFNMAIFMCGAAHRKSIIEKIGEYVENSETELNWTFYNNP